MPNSLNAYKSLNSYTQMIIEGNVFELVFSLTIPANQTYIDLSINANNSQVQTITQGLTMETFDNTFAISLYKNNVNKSGTLVPATNVLNLNTMPNFVNDITFYYGGTNNALAKIEDFNPTDRRDFFYEASKIIRPGLERILTITTTNNYLYRFSRTIDTIPLTFEFRLIYAIL